MILWCNFVPCKLPFGYHHLRVHRFVSRTPQHFCSIVENWFLGLVTWMLVPVTDSRGLSHSELFVLSRGLAMLDSRFRLQQMSKKHTLHLCKATLTVCTPDLKAPDLHWTIGSFGNPDPCYLQFSWVLHKVVCWLLALQSRRTIFNQENLACLHDMASHATNCFVSIKRVTEVVDVSGVPLLVAPLGNCRSIGSVPPRSCPSVPDIP